MLTFRDPDNIQLGFLARTTVKHRVNGRYVLVERHAPTTTEPPLGGKPKPSGYEAYDMTFASVASGYIRSDNRHA